MDWVSILVNKLMSSEESEEIFQKGTQIQHEIHQFRFGEDNLGLTFITIQSHLI